MYINAPKCQKDNANVILDESKVLELLKNNSKLTQKKIAEIIGKSDRTVKRMISSLEKKKYIERVNGKRFGY